MAQRYSKIWHEYIFKQLTQGAKDQHNEYIINEINQIKEAYKNAQLN